MSETAPHSTPDAHEAPTELHSTISPEQIGALFEQHQGLRAMKQQAREVFEFNEDTASSPREGRRQKEGMLERFAERLEGFRNSRTKQAQENFPETETRDAIIERLIEIAETPLGYIKDTPELTILLEQAKVIAAFDFIEDNGDQPFLTRQEKAARYDKKVKMLEDLAAKLSEFQETSPIGEANKQAVIDTIIHTAETPMPLPKPDEEEIPVLEEDEEAARQRALAYREHLAHMDRIDAADRLHGYDRVRALGKIALDLNGYDLGFGDLGVEAAKRIRSSKTRMPIGRILTRRAKYSDYYLHRMAISKGNVAAAEAMAHGGYVRHSSVYKGRNDALKHLSVRQDFSTQEGREDAIYLTSQMRGLRAGGARAEAFGELGALTGEIGYATAINGLFQMRRKQEAIAKVAVKNAKDGDTEQARAIASTHLRFPSIRDKALNDITKIEADRLAAEQKRLADEARKRAEEARKKAEAKQSKKKKSKKTRTTSTA